MTPKQRQRADELFDRLSEQAPEAWEAALGAESDTEVAAEVRRLLEALGHLPHEPPAERAPASVLRRGSRVGRYILRQVLGEGGFGVVYQAEQTEPVCRQVALKVIKPGMDSRAVLARFDQELQALGVMDHPCIARVIDGGATEEGRPYFVMDLVKGPPITEHCDRHRLGIRQRIELFIRVCEAVQHAHSKGVIHRDLKPSNILVEYKESGSVPKVIDFGVAKALNQRMTQGAIFTEQGQLVGTPEYMSPEQAEMGPSDIDTRSDVYSLGVVLYELLTGSRPFEPEELRKAGLAGIQRLIREVDPPRPSTRLSSLAATPSEPAAATRIAAERSTEVRSLTGILRRDLDWVVMKCLEKDRERRYETANSLAMDLRRFLSSEPVLAGPPSTAYRVRKFARRHRGGVIAASLIGGAVLAGLGGTTYGLVEARRQAAIATERADELTLVTEFQSELLSSIDPMAMGAGIRSGLRARVRDRAAQQGLDEGEINQHLSEYEAVVAGADFTGLALATVDRHIFEPAMQSISVQFEGRPLIRASLLQALGTVASHLDLVERALASLAQTVEIRRELLGDAAPATLQSMVGLGTVHYQRGAYHDAESLFDEVISRSEGAGRSAVEASVIAIRMKANLLIEQGAVAEAERLLAAAFELAEGQLGPQHPIAMSAANDLGLLLLEQKRFDEARELLQASHDFEAMAESRHRRGLCESLVNRAEFLREYGLLTEALQACEHSLRTCRRLLGDSHLLTLQASNNLGVVLVALDRAEAALPHHEFAATGGRELLGDRHPETLAFIGMHATCLQQLDRLVEAEELLRFQLDARRELRRTSPWRLTLSLQNLALVLEPQGRLEEAAELLEEAVAIARENPAAVSDGYAAIINLAGLKNQMEEFSEAASLAEEALAWASGALPEDHWGLGVILGHQRRALQGLGRWAEAERAALESHRILSSSLPEGHDRVINAARNVAAIYEQWHAAEPGAGHDATAAEWRQRLPDEESATTETSDGV